eukprot:TRINITY_DN440_c0_g1_i4.p1 TRINITY_DN440_c0_g1~~TRINITY_DN440_c0_g1_i4.p1  ORF type:complete len:233 (+),score=75.09 TRINITY_DN440_c0_g1_i4:100-699(+)
MCIRDSLFIVSLVSAEQIHYDKCDERWVLQLYNASGVCGTEEAPRDEDIKATIVTLLSDFLTTNLISCLDIFPCTPGVLIKHPELDNRNRLQESLGILIGDPTTNLPEIKKSIEAGNQAIIFVVKHGFSIAYQVNSDGFVTVDSRGNDKVLLDSEVSSGFTLELNIVQASRQEKGSSTECLYVIIDDIFLLLRTFEVLN